MSHEFLRRIGERVGLVESVQKRETREQNLVRTKEMEKERERRIHMLTNHSNACIGEIEYVLGISKQDPHPSHPITFTECDCETKI
jgi:hypothetical protein